MSRRRAPVFDADRARPLLPGVRVWAGGAVAAFAVLAWRTAPDAAGLASRAAAVVLLAFLGAAAVAALTRVPPAPRPRRQRERARERTSVSSWTPARKTVTRR